MSAILAELAAKFESRPPGLLIDPTDTDRWCATAGLVLPRLLDRLAAEVALGFHSRRLCYGFSDVLVNELCRSLYSAPSIDDANWPDLFWHTYLAFDAGEYTHPDRPDEDPIAAFTRPLIGAIVERLTHHD